MDLREQLASTLGGAYTLERELGGGGMSRVFVADERRLGRKVVVKVLSPELAAGISAERFEREIKLAASLQQANIVPVLSAGDASGLPFYTMPYVEGESLRARLGAPKPLGPTEVLRVLGDVARALQYAHERGVVHRDIKPDNVLLSGGTAVVTDFGIAKALSASRTLTNGSAITQLGTSIGTPAYMSPEQAAGDPDIDARADLYAFGCLAFELLAGHPPFNERTPRRVLAAHLNETPPDLLAVRPGISPALASLVMRCLAKEPDDRPQSASDIVRALDAMSTSGELASAWPAAYGPAGVRRALVLYVLAVVAVAVLARAATIVIGLPDWVVPGALGLMALGLPIILLTAYAHAVSRRAPTLTPGGTMLPPGPVATMALKAKPHLSWRRTTRAGVMGLVAFAAITAGFMVLRALGIGPAASLFAAGTLRARDPIMIAAFQVSHADTSVGSVVAEAVRANLAQSSSIVLATPASVAAALQRMQRRPDTRVDVPVAREIAAREGYKAIVAGTVTGLDDGYVVALRLVTADSGNTVASYQTTASGPAGLIEAVDVISRKLRGKIGESLRTVQGSPPLAQVTTASLAALRNYTIGSRANDVERDYPKAVEYLRQAVAIDSNFAMAWRKLSVALRNGGFPASASDSAIRRAHQLPDRLTEGERLLTDGWYYESGPGRDRVKAIEAYESLLKLGDSTSGAVLNNLALAYNSRREYARAESLFRAQMRVTPDAALGYSGVINALVPQGNVRDILPVVDSIRRRFPTNPTPGQFAIQRAYRERSFDALSRMLDSLRRSPIRPLRISATRATGQLALLRGKLQAATRWENEALALDSAAGVRLPAAAAEYLEIFRHSLTAGPSEAVTTRIDSLVPLLQLDTRPEIDRPYAAVARLYALNGRPDKAKAMLARMRAEVHDTAVIRARAPAVHFALGEIAIAERRGADAVNEFRQSDRLPDGPDGLDPLSHEVDMSRAFEAAGQPDSAIAHLEQFQTSPYYYRLVDDAFFLAGVYRRLGELYDAKGDRARAASYVAKFVDLWKDADPELQPKVAEARARLARLRGGAR
jgi:tetratricopeptide (TPR) repeat protein